MPFSYDIPKISRADKTLFAILQNVHRDYTSRQYNQGNRDNVYGDIVIGENTKSSKHWKSGGLPCRAVLKVNTSMAVDGGGFHTSNGENRKGAHDEELL